MSLSTEAVEEASTWLRLLDSDSEQVRERAKAASDRLCFPRIGTVRPGVVNWAEEKRLVRDSGLPAVLREVLRVGGPNAKAYAAVRLGLLKDDAATELLVAALRDPEVRVRRAAAKAFRHHRVRRAVPALEAEVLDSDEPTASAAMRALGAIGDPRALSTVLKWTCQPCWQRRQTAYQALGGIEHPDSTAAAQRGLADGKPQVRKAAKMALACSDNRRRRRRAGEDVS